MLKMLLVDYSRAVSTLLIGLIITIVFGLQRDFIFVHLDVVSIALLVSATLYVIYYAAGWLFAWRMNHKDRAACAICSGVNNNALSTGLALLYFSQTTIIFTILTEITWTVAIAVFKKFLSSCLSD